LAGFGPFESFSDALIAACPVILSKPNATVRHIQDPELALRVSAEYCAWVYYTPDDKYEMSMLTDQSDPGDALMGRTSCKLPPLVDDKRYPSSTLKYILTLHNHPFGTRLSLQDMRNIIGYANYHEWSVDTREGEVPISMIAFYSNSTDPSSPTCDGFYQYTPKTNELHQWARAQGHWLSRKIGTVVWLDEAHYRIETE
jgi:hypothetical protein